MRCLGEVTLKMLTIVAAIIGGIAAIIAARVGAQPHAPGRQSLNVQEFFNDFASAEFRRPVKRRALYQK